MRILFIILFLFLGCDDNSPTAPPPFSECIGNDDCSSITLYPDFTAIIQTNTQGEVVGQTGDNYGGCYELDLYNIGRMSDSNSDPEYNNLRFPYPNPFAYRSNIRFELAENRNFQLFIIDDLDNVLNIIIDETKLTGVYLAYWDGNNHPPGINYKGWVLTFGIRGILFSNITFD